MVWAQRVTLCVPSVLVTAERLQVLGAQRNKQHATDLAAASSTMSALPFDVPKVEIPKVEIPKVELPKLPTFTMPSMPSIDFGSIEVTSSVTAASERGRAFVEDSMKAASKQAESLSKNVKETVVLVRESVG